METKPTTNATGLPSREQAEAAAKRAAAMPPKPAAPLVIPPVASPVPVTPKPTLLKRLMTIVQFRKQQRKERMVLLTEELQTITTEDVRRRIRITKVTARKYLEELVREGRLTRQGKKGSYTYHPVSEAKS